MIEKKPMGIKPNTARVQKHRAQMKADGCRRLEVTLHSSVIEAMQGIAKREKMTMSLAVAYACIAYYRSRNRPEPV